MINKIYIEAYYCEVKLRKLFYRLHYYWIFFWFLNMQECLVLTLQGAIFYHDLLVTMPSPLLFHLAELVLRGVKDLQKH